MIVLGQISIVVNDQYTIIVADFFDDVVKAMHRNRAALVDVIRAKGGVREKDYVTLFDAHRRLRRAVAAFAAKVEASE